MDMDNETSIAPVPSDATLDMQQDSQQQPGSRKGSSSSLLAGRRASTASSKKRRGSGAGSSSGLKADLPEYSATQEVPQINAGGMRRASRSKAASADAALGMVKQTMGDDLIKLGSNKSFPGADSDKKYQKIKDALVGLLCLAYVAQPIITFARGDEDSGEISLLVSGCFIFVILVLRFKTTAGVFPIKKYEKAHVEEIMRAQNFIMHHPEQADWEIWHPKALQLRAFHRVIDKTKPINEAIGRDWVVPEKSSLKYAGHEPNKPAYNPFTSDDGGAQKQGMSTGKKIAMALAGLLVVAVVVMLTA